MNPLYKYLNDDCIRSIPISHYEDFILFKENVQKIQCNMNFEHLPHKFVIRKFLEVLNEVYNSKTLFLQNIQIDNMFRDLVHERVWRKYKEYL